MVCQFAAFPAGFLWIQVEIVNLAGGTKSHPLRSKRVGKASHRNERTLLFHFDDSGCVLRHVLTVHFRKQASKHLSTVQILWIMVLL